MITISYLENNFYKDFETCIDQELIKNYIPFLKYIKIKIRRIREGLNNVYDCSFSENDILKLTTKIYSKKYYIHISKDFKFIEFTEKD